MLFIVSLFLMVFVGSGSREIIWIRRIRIRNTEHGLKFLLCSRGIRFKDILIFFLFLIKLFWLCGVNDIAEADTRYVMTYGCFLRYVYQFKHFLKNIALQVLHLKDGYEQLKNFVCKNLHGRDIATRFLTPYYWL